MARKTKQEAERTFHALLDAAGRIFIRQGLAPTTLNDIATEAGLTRGAVYWHFKNKDAVIQALWQRNALPLHQEFLAALGQLQGPDSGAQFVRLLKDILARALREPEVGLVLRIVVNHMEFTDDATPLQRFLLDQHQAMTDAVCGAFAVIRSHQGLCSELPDMLLANALQSYLHGLLHMHYIPGREEIDLLRNGDQLIDLFLDGVLRQTV